METLSDVDAAARQAAVSYVLRSEKHEIPRGEFTDGRWNPAKEEAQQCCDAVREPSRVHWDSRLRHCKTLKHCAVLHGADYPAAKLAVKKLRLAGIQEVIRQERTRPPTNEVTT